MLEWLPDFHTAVAAEVESATAEWRITNKKNVCRALGIHDSTLAERKEESAYINAEFAKQKAGVETLMLAAAADMASDFEAGVIRASKLNAPELGRRLGITNRSSVVNSYRPYHWLHGSFCKCRVLWKDAVECKRESARRKARTERAAKLAKELEEIDQEPVPMTEPPALPRCACGCLESTYNKELIQGYLPDCWELYQEIRQADKQFYREYSLAER